MPVDPALFEETTEGAEVRREDGFGILSGEKFVDHGPILVYKFLPVKYS